jgi:hypothetical protein
VIRDGIDRERSTNLSDDRVTNLAIADPIGIEPVLEVFAINRAEFIQPLADRARIDASYRGCLEQGITPFSATEKAPSDVRGLEPDRGASGTILQRPAIIA